MSFLKTHITKMLEANDKKSLFSFIGSLSFAKMIVDGNMAYNSIFRSVQGKCVGTDHYGNKYFEQEEEAYGRRRWVVYANKFDYNPTSIPPEWHGWINYINDYNPKVHELPKPKYFLQSSVTNTGTDDIAVPKGAWKNPQKRNWLKYEAWQPPKSA